MERRLVYVPYPWDRKNELLWRSESLSEANISRHESMVRESAQVNVCLQSDGLWHIDDDEMGFPSSDAACEWARDHIGPYVAVRIMQPRRRSTMR